MRKRCPWSQQEDDLLRVHRGTMSNKRMAALLTGRTPDAVQMRCKLLGLYKRDLRPTPVPKESKIVRWPAEDIATLRACAGEFPDAIQALHFPHRTTAAVRTMMAKLGIPTWTAVHAARAGDLQVAA